MDTAPETCNKLRLKGKCKACRNKGKANSCERRKSWFAAKIALNNETLIVVCKIFAVNLSEHCLQPQTLFYCLQGKRKRLAAGSYCEEVEEEDVTSSVSRRKIAKK